MYCMKCGKQIPDHSRFCTECGAAQAAAPGAPRQEATRAAQPAAAQKTAGDKTYWLLAVISIIVSIMNIADMKDGIYMVILGIPIQYVMIPAAVLFVILALKERKQ